MVPFFYHVLPLQSLHLLQILLRVLLQRLFLFLVLINNLNMPMGFGFIEGPTPDTDMTLPEAQQKMDAGIKRVQEERAQRESDIAANRDNFFGNLRDRVFGIGQDYKLELAGGGIAKIAGVDQGPPPESGPNSQGLQGLLKRVRNL